MTLLKGILAKTLLNTSEVPQEKLNIQNKLRSNPLSWSGQFSPQLIQVLLKKYAAPGSTLFDPFLGSGTVLLEAGLAGLAAGGAEINPAAVALSQTCRFINAPSEQRRRHLNEISQLLEREFPPTLPLFQPAHQSQSGLDAAAIQSKLLESLTKVRERLSHQLLETLIVLADLGRSNLSTDQIFAAWKKLAQHVIGLPFSEQPITVYRADARKTPLTDSSIDLVVTSPPYINVFNYHQQYRASMEALNWNLLQVARSEIGSNRKHRGNRFLTVIQYCLDLSQTLREMSRVCRPDSRLIFIVGRESRVRGTGFFNGEIVTEIAHRASGFDLILRQERVYLNRFGQNIFEDILHFSSPTSEPNDAFLERAREVAQDVLEAAYVTAPDKAKDDIKSALTSINTVPPSPIFTPSKARKDSHRCQAYPPLMVTS